MRLLFLPIIIILSLVFSWTSHESYGDDVSSETRKWRVDTGPTPESKEMAFIKSDLVVTGTITSAENTQKGVIQYLVQIDDYLKNTENQETQSGISNNFPLTLTVFGNDVSAIFKKDDLVYLFLDKDPENGQIVISSSSHKIIHSCQNIQNPNSPIFSIMSTNNLLTSESKTDHFASYPVHEEIIFNYYALNAEIEPIILNVEFNVTPLETPNFENIYHFSKEIKLASCNGHQLLEWSFTPTVIGEYVYTLDVSDPNESFTKKAFNVYPLEEFEKIEQPEIKYNTDTQEKSFTFEIMGLKQVYELNELPDVGIQVFGLGCGNNFIEISKNNNVIYQDVIKNNYDFRPNACGMAHGIPINNPDAEPNIAITEPGQYRISAWLEQFNSTLIYSEKPFVIFDKEAIPPLKQLRLGVDLKSVQCKDDLVLILKSDNHPACVKPETKIKLIERGWAIQTELAIANRMKPSLEEGSITLNIWTAESYVKDTGNSAIKAEFSEDAIQLNKGTDKMVSLIIKHLGGANAKSSVDVMISPPIGHILLPASVAENTTVEERINAATTGKMIPGGIDLASFITITESDRSLSLSTNDQKELQVKIAIPKDLPDEFVGAGFFIPIIVSAVDPDGNSIYVETDTINVEITQ